ncbi:proline-rich protein 29 isoform X1 [Cebus imitator]|uniref:proline-rich protein 29 isoform X1 n=1 Tax=Cebus imitator TaxID=2715852 RepID=UPI00189BAFCB|nr:proline-rich protein 29 isoform X1 [Cebus imitator]
MGRPTCAPAARPCEGRPAGADDAAERADAPAAAESPGGRGAAARARLALPSGVCGWATGVTHLRVQGWGSSWGSCSGGRTGRQRSRKPVCLSGWGCLATVMYQACFSIHERSTWRFRRKSLRRRRRWTCKRKGFWCFTTITCPTRCPPRVPCCPGRPPSSLAPSSPLPRVSPTCRMRPGFSTGLLPPGKGRRGLCPHPHPPVPQGLWALMYRRLQVGWGGGQRGPGLGVNQEARRARVPSSRGWGFPTITAAGNWPVPLPFPLWGPLRQEGVKMRLLFPQTTMMPRASCEDRRWPGDLHQLRAPWARYSRGPLLHLPLLLCAHGCRSFSFPQPQPGPLLLGNQSLLHPQESLDGPDLCHGVRAQAAPRPLKPQ